jgi:hypothetical protein
MLKDEWQDIRERFYMNTGNTYLKAQERIQNLRYVRLSHLVAARIISRLSDQIIHFSQTISRFGRHSRYDASEPYVELN